MRPKKQKTIVVLGTARSGTSMIGGMLNILGVNMGQEFIETDEFNPKGYFEDKDFVNLTDEIFESARSNYWQFPSYRKILAQKEKFDDKIRRLIGAKSKNKKIWGWKDPWTNITIELFLPHLINPHFIIIFRNIMGTAESSVEFTEAKEAEFWVKKRIDFFHALELANFYEKLIFNFLKKNPDLQRIFISFEDTIENPIRESEKIADFLRIKLSKEKIKKINEFVIPRKKENFFKSYK